MSLRPTHAVFLVAALSCNSPSSSPEAPASRAAGDSSAGSSDTTSASPLPKLDADAREPMLARGIAQILEAKHLRDRPLDDEVSAQAFSEYIDRLDPGKLFLLREHVHELESYADAMDDQMRDGNLVLAHAGAALMAQRRDAIADMVSAKLAEPFDFAEQERIETDPDKFEFAGSEDELADRWRRMLKLQVLQRIARMEETAEALAQNHDEDGEKQAEEAKRDPADAGPGTSLGDDIPETFAGREKKARAELADSYEGRFERLANTTALQAAETFLNAVASAYDPHTAYLAPADKENFDIQMSGSLEGIGAVLSPKDHYIVVRDIVPGGASWRQGELEAGDLILEVAQNGEDPVDVADMRLDKVVQMIRGPKGTDVTLTVRKADDTIEVITITRDIVQIEAAYARGAILDLGAKHGSMGYIKLPSFYGNTRSRRGSTPERSAPDDVRALLEELSKRGAEGVILDLRGNGGGLLDYARDITGMFIETGPVVQTRYSNGKSQVLEDKDPSVSFRGEVVVLVDRFSASASEILAGALQDYHRAVVVGTSPTHGKGTVQMLLDLDQMRTGQGQPLGVLKLTIQQFFRINGDSTQVRGVVPDLVLADPTAHIESGERYLDNAIPWSEVEPLEHDDWPSAWDPEAIEEASRQRRAAEAVFSQIQAHSALLKAHGATTKIPLHRKSWHARREHNRIALEAVSPELDDASARFSVETIEYAEESADGARAKTWKQELARDPWVEEALHVLGDMAAAGE